MRKRTDPIHIRKSALSRTRLVTMCGLNLPLKEWYYVDDPERATCKACIAAYQAYVENRRE